MKLLSTICLILVTFLPSRAEEVTRDSVMISVKHLRSDVDYLKTILETAHPSLYRYISRTSLNASFNAAAENMQAMTALRFWSLMQPITAQIGCGHTYLRLPPGSASGQSSSDIKILPFYVRVEGEQLFVSRFIQSPMLMYNINDEVISINEVPAKTILSKVRGMISGDGHTNAYKDFKLETGGFNWLYATLFETKENFEIVFKRKDEVFKLNLYSRVTPRTFKPAINPASDPIALNFPADLPQTAHLRIKHFNYSKFLPTHDSIFRQLELKQIKNLVIDLRNNPGGRSDVAIDLMKYLLHGRFRFTTITEGIAPPGQLASIFTTNSPKKSLMYTVSRKPYEKMYVGNGYQSPYNKAFTGKVFLLINGGTFSSASLLAASLKSQGSFIVVGSESGGASFGCNGGKVLAVDLPHSKLRLNLPIMWTYSASKETIAGRGLIPDYHVRSLPLRVDDPSFQKADPCLLQVKKLL